MVLPVSSDKNLLDYSFMGIRQLQSISDHVPSESTVNENHGVEKHVKYKVNTVKFTSNHIEDISDLKTYLQSIVFSIKNIKWIDLSNNKITKIGHSFSGFENVTVLYLHANNISSFGALKQLKTMQNLTSLTLYGNPIGGHKHYKNYILHILPSLDKLDFSLITKQDREACKTWTSMFRHKIDSID